MSKGSGARVLGVLVVLACAGGCPRRGDQAPPTPGPATEEEARVWADGMVKALNSCDLPALEQHMDMEVLVEQAISGRARTPAMHRGLRAGMKQGSRKMLENICADRGDGRFKLLRVHAEAGTAHALLRLVASDGTNYLDFVLGKRPGATEARASDAYNFVNGQRLSETVGELIEMAADGSAARATDRLRPLQRAADLFRSGKHQEALSALERADPEMRSSRGARTLELQIAANVSDEAYQRAIASYQQAYPGDPSIDFVSIDGFLLRQDYPAALAAVDRLDKRVSDPYLRVLRGIILKLAGRLEEAHVQVDRAIALEPDLPEAYWELLGLGAGQGDFAAAARAVKTLRDLGEPVTREQLIELGGYEEFLASKEAAPLFAD